MASALIGGTLSQLTGGKFANGAVGGALSSWLNEPIPENKPDITGSDKVAFCRRGWRQQ